ncbi:molybdopterin converting factor subunit 1 [Iodobacter fluviatilis]|uniref:Molybdopterin synthase sulfur carrier subunit n=1 Tax=Iodobacter fluviatilis TaxID=537 RepID=A0A377SV88_9NEIS|nr:molybdopterin converting factor subunit 1 [Iodobacter fluviatilis]TCU85655.1 molybdopterin synthase subunit MoaD [Iodobacter fluviatilis]STR44897.1 Sulfur carrier protein moaD [Iodobacter fluviatilis]
MIRVLYFARLRDAFGCSEEALPAYATVAELIAVLAARGGVWADELSPSKVFRVAVNQEMARLQDEIPAGAEVAIFPPVTGG